eukprot:1663472-Pleurochrysis_carterae.AAC.4
MPRLTSGNSLTSELLPHFCSHALAVKRGGSRVTINPAQPPHLTALSVASVSAARAYAAARSACSARAAKWVAVVIATTATRRKAFALASGLAPTASFTSAKATRFAARRPSTTALANSSMRKSGTITLTAPLGRRTASIAGRVRTSASLPPSSSISALGRRAGRTGLSATMLRISRSVSAVRSGAEDGEREVRSARELDAIPHASRSRRPRRVARIATAKRSNWIDALDQDRLVEPRLPVKLPCGALRRDKWLQAHIVRLHP